MRCSAHDTSSGRGAAKRMDLPTAIEVVARAHTSSQWRFRERERNSTFYRRCFHRNTGKDNAYAAVFSRFAELLGLPTKLFDHTWAAFLPVERNVSNPNFVAFRDVRRGDGGLPECGTCCLRFIRRWCSSPITLGSNLLCLGPKCCIPVCGVYTAVPGHMLTTYIVTRSSGDPTKSLPCKVILVDGDATCECAEDNKRYVV
jgi:hypothetical protein